MNAKRLRECGVKVIAGTDAGASMARFEEAMHIEMECLVGAGRTPREALEAGTLGSATAIGRDKEIGSLEPASWLTLWSCGASPQKTSPTSVKWSRYFFRVSS